MDLHDIVDDFKADRDQLKPDKVARYVEFCEDLYVTSKFKPESERILCLKLMCNLVACFSSHENLELSIKEEWFEVLTRNSKTGSVSNSERLLCLKLLGNLLSCPSLGKMKSISLCNSLNSNILNDKLEENIANFSSEMLDAFFMVVNSVLRSRYLCDVLEGKEQIYGENLGKLLNLCLDENKPKCNNFEIVLQYTIIDVIALYQGIFEHFDKNAKLAASEILLESAEDFKDLSETSIALVYQKLYLPMFKKLSSPISIFTQVESNIFRNSIGIFCEWSVKESEKINETTPELSLTVLNLLKSCRKKTPENVEEREHLINKQNKDGFVSDLTRLLANLVHQNKYKQDECYDYLTVLLENCRIDQNNPLLMEWNILLIRNLMEKNERNQKFVAQLKAEELVPDSVFEKMGLKEILERKIVGK